MCSRKKEPCSCWCGSGVSGSDDERGVDVDAVVRGLQERWEERSLVEKAEAENRGGKENRSLCLDDVVARDEFKAWGVNPMNQFSEKYMLGEVVGRGSTCTVYTASNKKDKTGVAVKLVQGEPMSDDDPLPGHCSAEIHALRACSGHPNIVHLEDAFFERRSGRVYIVTELLHGGELFDYVVRKGSLSEVEAADIIRDVASALEYMHSKGVIHRDLKPENLLLFRDPPPRTSPHVKIIDFGLSKILASPASSQHHVVYRQSSYTTKKPEKQSDYTTTKIKPPLVTTGSYSASQSPLSHIPPPPEQKLQKQVSSENNGGIVGALFASSFLGTRGYLAPEMLKRRNYAASVDIWALGVIAFVLLCGCLPFDDDLDLINSPAASKKFRLRFPSWASSLSPLAKDFLAQLLHVDPRIRPTAAKAASHAWLRPDAHIPHSMLRSPALIKAAAANTHHAARASPLSIPKPPADQQPPRPPPQRSHGSFA